MKKFIVAALALGLSGPTVAASECNDAIDSYNMAIDNISFTLKRYGNCVASSHGRDDCSTEFRRLKYAQDDFESAVLRHQSDCE
jgi:hypothetical protein